MNKKTLLLAVLVLSLSTTSAFAGIFDEYDKAKQKLQNVDAKVTQTRKDISNAQSATQNNVENQKNVVNKAIQAQKKETKNKIQTQKKEALKVVQANIDAKKAEIKAVESNTAMFKKQKELKLKVLNAELKSLQNKYDSTAKYYDKQLNAIK